MIAWFKIALRNLVKNRRRSIITSMAIALGFAAVILFDGFTEYMYTGTREIAIYGIGQGHLTIFKRGFLEKGQVDPARYLLTPEEMKTIEKTCKEIPGVLLVTPQLYISGLITNGKISTIFIGHGIVPSAVDLFASRAKFIQTELRESFEGKKLSDDAVYGVGLARDLAHMLDLMLGSNAVVFSNTVDGQMNALDVEVFQLFDAASDVLNDKIIRTPFKFAQMLYDTQGADRMAVLLSRTEDTELIRDRLKAAFARRGMEFDIKTWKEMNQWYRRVKDMFDTIFLFLFIIVFVVVVMSVINTMGMAVIERTREIGTLRALGLKRRGVMLLFSIEGGLMGIFGMLGGLILTLLSGWGVNLLKPTWVPPGLPRRVPISIEFVPQSMVYCFVFLFVLCLIASLLPARRAARQNVVDALAHV